MTPALREQVEHLLKSGFGPTAVVNALENVGKYVCYDAVRRVAKGISKARCEGRKPRTNLHKIPEGFDELARVLPTKPLSQKLGVSPSTVRLWRRVRNIPSPGRGGSPKLVKPKTSIRSGSAPYKPAPVTIHRDVSVAGRAVSECLQKLGRIFRCDPDGRVNPKGTHWNRNGFILTDDDVIDRARRNGWSPDAWERIAA